MQKLCFVRHPAGLSKEDIVLAGLKVIYQKVENKY